MAHFCDTYCIWHVLCDAWEISFCVSRMRDHLTKLSKLSGLLSVKLAQHLAISTHFLYIVQETVSDLAMVHCMLFIVCSTPVCHLGNSLWHSIIPPLTLTKPQLSGYIRTASGYLYYCIFYYLSTQILWSLTTTAWKRNSEQEVMLKR